MGYFILGQTLEHDLYTRYESGIPQAHVLRRGVVVLEINPEIMRELQIHIDLATKTVKAITQIDATAHGHRIGSDPTAAIIGGILFHVGSPMDGKVIDKNRFQSGKPILARATSNFQTATLTSDLNLTGDRVVGRVPAVAEASRNTL